MHRSTFGAQLETCERDSLGEIGAASGINQRRIGTASGTHRSAIRVPSRRRQWTHRSSIGNSSEWNRNPVEALSIDISERHRGRIGARSESRRGIFDGHIGTVLETYRSGIRASSRRCQWTHRNSIGDRSERGRSPLGISQGCDEGNK